MQEQNNSIQKYQQSWFRDLVSMTRSWAEPISSSDPAKGSCRPRGLSPLSGPVHRETLSLNLLRGAATPNKN